MRTTIYIIGYEGDRWLPDCIATLRQASAGPVSLVLIDNYKNPCIPELDLDAFVDARVVKTPRRMGFADAHNFGVLEVPPKTETAVMLNQDTLSGEEWLDRCVACFEEDERLGALCPATRTYEWNGWDVAFLACAKKNDEFTTLENEGEARRGHYFEVPEVPAAAMMVRTSAMQNLGLFDPVFGSYYEDFDLCRRYGRAGWKVGICPSAKLAHYSGSVTSTPEAERRRTRLLLRNRLIQSMREAGPRRFGALARHLIGKVPRNLVRGMLRTPSSQPVSATLGAHWDFLKVVERMLSEKRDIRAWEAYLENVGWPRKTK
jgi:N-acetylglucosaminyl-diphospho-decaprenol L-rhamnosyltransferase